ncbi:MAG: aminotransferase class V-fold PLP-dependent enzyme [Planctomycetaceae bacterium]|nr:aminotransferase class V-fold PLP-dependent enzyme [Planctomycetales bacterium]MCB9926710.1 aminotransferase class V-fold PLP-dependent enzyme [Planctomycetaceae bacterium]
MPPSTRIYLDNAATSWPKPAVVYDAIDRYQRLNGAPSGRGAFREAVEVERIVTRARKRVADLLAVADPNHVIFTSSGTDSLNLAIHGLLRPGDHVVTTVCEHNSVLRPLRYLEQTAGITVTRVGCDQVGVVEPSAIELAINSRTKLLILTHVSNVTGAIQPANEIGLIAKAHGISFLLDAAQSLGHLRVSVEELHADLVAAPGHKGLLGPLGTGILYVGPSVVEVLRSHRQGGTGTSSESDLQPANLPDKYESGNHNVPGIVGLEAALGYLADRDADDARKYEQTLVAKLVDGFDAIERVAVHGPCDAARQVGVVSITVDGYDPQEIASLLDTAYSVQVRSGFHCAPLMHNSLGTKQHGGTVRFSVGPFNTFEQIDHAIEAVGEIAASAI